MTCWHLAQTGHLRYLYTHLQSGCSCYCLSLIVLCFFTWTQYCNTHEHCHTDNYWLSTLAYPTCPLRFHTSPFLLMLSLLPSQTRLPQAELLKYPIFSLSLSYVTTLRAGAVSAPPTVTFIFSLVSRLAESWGGQVGYMAPCQCQANDKHTDT